MARGRDPGFRVIVALTDQFTRPINNLSTKLAQSTARIRGLAQIPGAILKTTGLTQIGGAIGRVGGGVLQLRNAVTGLLGPFARLGGLLGGVALGQFVFDAVSAGGQLVKLAQSTGFAVERLQELQYAAKQSNVAGEAMTGALTKMNKALADATKTGKGLTEAQKGLAALGFSPAQIKQGVNASDAFNRIADAVARASDHTTALRIASTFFGKSAAQILPVLKEGTAGLTAFADEARALGIVMTTDTARSAKAFGDIMTRLGEHMRGLAYEVLRQLLPAMTGGAEAMDEWIKANREWITTEIVSIIRDLVGIGKAFVDLVRSDLVPAVKALSPLWDGLTTVLGKNNAMLLAFTSVVAPGIIGALVSIGKAILGLGVALAANPIGAIITAIAVAALLIWKYWEPISAFFIDLWGKVQTAFSAALGWLGDFGRQFAGGFIEDAWKPLTRFFVDLWAGISGIFSGALAWLGDFVGRFVPQPILDAWAATAGFFSSLWNAPRRAFEAALGWLDDFADRFTAASLEGDWRALAGLFGEVWAAISSAFRAGIEATLGLLAALVPQPEALVHRAAAFAFAERLPSLPIGPAAESERLRDTTIAIFNAAIDEATARNDGAMRQLRLVFATALRLIAHRTHSPLEDQILAPAAPMPSLVCAHWAYREARQAQRIRDANPTAHPNFMPPRLVIPQWP